MQKCSNRYAATQGWRCPEHARELNARHNPRQIRAGGAYMGMADTSEQAREINVFVAGRVAQFRAKQREDYANHKEAL